MTGLSVDLAAELAKDRARMFVAVEFNFPDTDVRLLNGSAELSIGGNLFAGEHELFGAIESITDFSDGAGDQAPGMVIALLPAMGAETSDVASADMQESRTRVWIGAVNETTGAVVGEPYLLMDGENDVAVANPGPRMLSVDYDTVGSMERLFEAEEGMRLAATFWESVWPGNHGLRHVTGVQDNPYWGQNAPNGVSSIAATAAGIFAGG